LAPSDGWGQAPLHSLTQAAGEKEVQGNGPGRPPIASMLKRGNSKISLNPKMYLRGKTPLGPNSSILKPRLKDPRGGLRTEGEVVVGRKLTCLEPKSKPEEGLIRGR